MRSPYGRQPKEAFWRTGVAAVSPFDLGRIYRRKFDIGARRVATAGSCFAQHIGRALRARGFAYVDCETPPAMLPAAEAAKFGYGQFSARYGNVYTARQLLQLVERAYGEFAPSDDAWSAEDGRCFDPFRPAVEPGGFASEEEMRACREGHLAAVREVFETAEVFVFTLGLTEAWVSTRDGAAFPTCPGTVAGTFDPAEHRFVNLTYPDVMADMRAAIERIRAAKGDMRFLLTVSPVPLAATATKNHVVTATTYSKSTLRAVAGDLADELDFVDYFPSYELITAPAMGGMFFEPDKRNVARHGVDFVMKRFFAEHRAPRAVPKAAARPAPTAPIKPDDMRVACEESALEKWAPA